MKTIELKTAVVIELGHVTNLDQSESSKIITSHMTQQGKQTLTNRKLCNFKQTLTNRKLCNFAQHFLQV